MAHEEASGSTMTDESTPIASPSNDENLPDPPESLFLPEQLPSANIARIMKQTLPVTSKISREAKDAMSLCVSEFISFLTSEANDRSIAEKRKTLTGDDILHALRVLGFENYETVCTIWLAKYRSVSCMTFERLLANTALTCVLQAQNVRPRGRRPANKDNERHNDDEEAENAGPSGTTAISSSAT